VSKHSGIKILLEERNFAPIASILPGSFSVQSAALLSAHTRRLCISHGTDTIMTRYDTGRTKIPFGPLDVCIWVSPFLAQDSALEGTRHQCSLRGLFSEPLNLCYNYHYLGVPLFHKASYCSPLSSNSLWTLMQASLQYLLGTSPP
jgi:hypothetical protein